MRNFLTTSIIAGVAAVLALSVNITAPSSDWVSYDEWQVTVNEAEARARSGGFSRSFSSRSSRSSSFSFKRSSNKSKRSSKSLWNRSSSSRTATTTSSGGYKKTTTATKPTSGSYKKRTTTPSTRTANRPTTGATGRSVQRRAASKNVAKHRTESSRFSRKSNTLTSASTYRNNPIVTRTTRTNYVTVYRTRDTFYGGVGWSRPGYMYRSSASFGMWDGVFMWYMLDNMNNRRYRDMYYNHRNDAGFQQWRQEATRLSADNADLRRKLEAMDQNMVKIEATGQKVDPNYMPKGVDATVVLAAEIVTGSGDLTLVMGTGGKTGNYYAFCKMIAEHSSDDLNVKCKNTNGSVGNLEGLVAGNFGAIMVQSDVLNEWLRQNPGVKIDALQSSIYPEVVFLLANRNAGVESIKDIDPRKHRIYFAGSGSAKTMAGFVRQDSSYLNLYRQGVQVPPNAASLKLVANNPNAVMFYVCGLNCGLIKLADTRFGSKLTMAAVDDWDFNDAEDQFGQNIYRFITIPETYPNLQEGGWVSSGDVESLVVDAIFIVSKDWVQEKGVKGLTALEDALWPAMTAIQQRVGVPE